MGNKKNYIIKCDSTILNEKVQIKILAKGYKWSEGAEVTQYTEKPVLVFDNLNNDGRAISYHDSLMTDSYKKYSCYQKHKIISAEEFLALKTF